MRPTWTGSLSFGLITIPVQLVTATVDLDAHFRQLHGPDGSRVEQHPFCPTNARAIAGPPELVARSGDRRERADGHGHSNKRDLSPERHGGQHTDTMWNEASPGSRST